MSEIATAYVQIEPTFKGVKGKLDKELGDAGESSGKSSGSKFGAAFGSVVGTAGKAIGKTLEVATAAVAVGGAAVSKVVSSSVQSYADYEQLVGGVETLFGQTEEEAEALRQSMLASGMSVKDVDAELASMSTGADIVMSNAAKAFETAGMSANDYMETVTSFSASLLQSLDGDTVKAAEAADMAVRDMSDNANKMGTDIGSIQNAYQGFAKQNYTMLDNLKLGYGGTKSEMERLLEDATKLSGVEYNIDSLSDVYEAIHVVQTEMGITGTTALEASTTISGSLGTLKAAWENVLIGMGDKGSDMSSLIGDLVKSAETFIGNMIPVIEQALTGVTQLITQLAPVIAQEVPALLTQVLPPLVESAGQIVEALGQGLLAAIPTLLPVISQLLTDVTSMITQNASELAQLALEIVMSISQALIDNLEPLIQAGMEMILELAMGLAQALPTLIPTIVEVVLNIVQYLLNNINLIIDAAIELMVGLVTGIVQAIPQIVAALPQIISALYDGLIHLGERLKEIGKPWIDHIKNGIVSSWNNIVSTFTEKFNSLKSDLLNKVKNFIDAGKNLVDSIKNGISNTWSNIVSTITGKISSLKSDLLGKVRDFVNIGQNIVDGIKEGISNAWSGLTSHLQSQVSSLVNGVKGFFKIGSPSRLMADEVGQWIPAGMAVGIESNLDEVTSATDDMMNAALGDSLNSLAGARYNFSPDMAQESAPLTINMTINGAEGQDINSLADIIQERINNAVNQRGFVYA